MKTLSIILLLLTPIICFAQNINLERVEVSLYRLPLKPLYANTKTFTVSIQDLGDQLSPQQILNLENKITIPGFARTQANASVSLEIILSPLSITSKELRDSPLTVEKEGVKTVHHAYSYFLNCSFPVKLRVIVNNDRIIEQDFPAFFQTKYYGRDTKTEGELQSQWDNDYTFSGSLLNERLSEHLKELQEFLFSNYGDGMRSQFISVGYVKDKKGEYDDLTKAMSLTREALLLASDRLSYVADEFFQSKAAEAINIYKQALTEASNDKKSRINPKVTAMIHYNLGVIYFAKHDYDSAKVHLDKSETGSSATVTESLTMLRKVNDFKKRALSNSRNEGQTVSSENQSTHLASLSDNDYIIDQSQDTVQVRFVLPSSNDMPFGDTVWLQDKIIIVMESNNAIELFPNQLQGFCYGRQYYESLWWVEDLSTTPWTIEKKFCKQIVPGAIPVFSCNEIETDEEGYKRVTANLYYKQDEKYIRAMFLNFNRAVSKLVSGCPGLSQKVRDGKFPRDAFVSIISEYNKTIQPKTSH
ncbi:MAG TPA: hypothetical protein VIQ51_11425 [Chryseosolibacter sp.]